MTGHKQLVITIKEGMSYPVKHAISLIIVLSLLWLGLSGHFDALLLSLGFVSVLLIVAVTLRMDAIDHEIYPVHIPAKLLRFWFFLGVEVIKSNIDVLKRIFTPGKSISPQFFELPIRLKSNLSRVIYANAITLTPGTVSVKIDLNKESIVVHSLSIESAEDLCSGRMARSIPENEELYPEDKEIAR